MKALTCLKCRAVGSGRFCTNCMNSPLIDLDNGLFEGKYKTGKK